MARDFRDWYRNFGRNSRLSGPSVDLASDRRLGGRRNAFSPQPLIAPDVSHCNLRPPSLARQASIYGVFRR